MNDTIIHLDKVVKNYMIGTIVVRALQSISLEIKRNEYVAIMGPH
jgi:putative ABC transport system ATP-binding protein